MSWQLLSRERAFYLAIALSVTLILALVPFLRLTPDETRGLLALIIIGVVSLAGFVRTQARLGWRRLAPIFFPWIVFLATLTFAVLYHALPSFWVFYFVFPLVAALIYGVTWTYLSGALAALGYLIVATIKGSLANPTDELFNSTTLVIFTVLAGRLAASERRHTHEQQALAAVFNEFATMVNRALDLSTLLADALRLVTEFLRIETAWVMLVDEATGELVLAADHNLPPVLAADDKREMHWRPCRCQRMFREGKLTDGVNVLACERFERAGIAAHHACVPLRSGDRVLGLLNVATATGDPLTFEDSQTLGAMGAQLGIAIERTRLYERVKARWIEEQAALLRFSQSLVGLLIPDAILDRAVETAQEIFHADAISLMLSDEPRKNLILRAGRGLDPALYGTFVVDLATSREGYAFRNGKVMRQEGVQGSSPFSCPLGLHERGFCCGATAPLNAQNVTLGTLCVHFRKPRTFSEDDVRLLSLIANQTAVAYERARLHADAQERLERITALHRIDVAITTALNLEETLNVLLEKVMERLRVDAAAVALIQRETQELIYAARCGLDGEFFIDGLLKVKEGIAGQVAYSGEPAAITDVSAEPRFVRRPIAEKLGIVSYLAVPLRARGEIIGVLEMATRERHTFLPEEVEFFMTLAGQAGIAIENARLFEETHRRADELTTLTRVSREITAAPDLLQVLTLIAQRAAELSHSDASGVFACAPDGRLRAMVGYGVRDEFIEAINAQGVLSGHGAIGRATAERHPVQIPDRLAEPDYPFDSLAMTEHIRAILAVPMLRGGPALSRSAALAANSAEGEVIGGIVLWHRQPRHFIPQEVTFVQALAQQCVNAVENARLFTQAQERLARLSALHEIELALTSTLNLHERLDILLEHTVARMRADISAVFLSDAATHELGLAAQRGTRVAEFERGFRLKIEGLTGWIVEHNEPVVILDVHQDARWVRDDVSEADGIISYLGAPLSVKGRVIGVLDMATRTRREYAAEEVGFFMMLAGQAAVAIESARLFEEVQRRLAERQQAEREIRLLQTITQAVNEAEDLHSALTVVLEKVCRATGWVLGEAWVPSPDGTYLECSRAWYSMVKGLEEFIKASETFTFLPGVGLPGRVWTSKRPVWIPNVTMDTNFPRAPIAKEVCLKAAMGIPVLTGDQVVAVIDFFVFEPREEDERLVSLVSAVAAQLGSAIRRKRAEEEKERLFEQIRIGRERLRELAQQVVSAQEEERQRVSRELHDEAGQALTALKINLEVMHSDVPIESEVLRQRIKEAASLTDTTLERIRLLAQDLRPPALDAVGLGPALEDFCRDFERRTRLAIHYAGAVLPTLPDAVTICFYRVLQEALTNVAKHACAKQVWVALSYDGHTVSLSVADDGQGFDTQPRTAVASRRTGLGLLGMRERLGLLGGRLEIESRPVHGTRLVAHIPWKES